MPRPPGGDTLREEREASSPIALTLHQFQAMNVAFGDAVAPRQAEPSLDGGQIILQPPGETGQFWDVAMGRLRHPRFQAWPRRSRTMARKAWASPWARAIPGSMAQSWSRYICASLDRLAAWQTITKDTARADGP